MFSEFLAVDKKTYGLLFEKQKNVLQKLKQSLRHIFTFNTISKFFHVSPKYLPILNN